MRPNRSAHPLPFLDDVRICSLDERSYLLNVAPRQSPSSEILFEMSSDADFLPTPDFFIPFLEVP